MVFAGPQLSGELVTLAFVFRAYNNTDEAFGPRRRSLWLVRAPGFRLEFPQRCHQIRVRGKPNPRPTEHNDNGQITATDTETKTYNFFEAGRAHT